VQPYGRPTEQSGTFSGELFFRYRIERCLGRGGMGEVYEAFDTRLRRFVALKILTNAVDASQDAELRRLLSEARALAAIQHRNIVTVYDIAEHDGVPYLTMELLRGRSLGAIAKSGNATTADKLRWLLEIASALAAVHRAGVVHRDVKPGNVMVTEDGAAVLFDFGIARPANPNVVTYDGQSVRGGMVIGTPRYMAPEVTAGTRASASTDQYAWGVIAAELLAGKKPPRDADIAQLLHAAALPKALEAIVLRATDRRAEFRHASMDEVVTALEPLVRAPLPERKPRTLRSIAFVAGISILVGGNIGVVWATRGAPAHRAPVTSADAAPIVITESTVSSALIATSTTSTTSATPLVPLPAESSQPAVAHLVTTTTTPVIPQNECSADADCACGVSRSTGACAIGPATRIDTSRRCPDFCEGFEGNLVTTCHAGRCVKSRSPN
jgi:serine/threonine protein kinase